MDSIDISAKTAATGWRGSELQSVNSTVEDSVCWYGGESEPALYIHTHGGRLHQILVELRASTRKI